MRFAVQKLSFAKPSPFELYLPQGPAPLPLICMNPILGRLIFLEDLFFERRFAHFFASNGLAAVLIDRPLFQFNPGHGLEQIQDYLETSVSRSKAVLDSLSGRGEIDFERLGTFGISFGAVVNALWAAQDSRLRAHVFALVGGNLPEVFVTSRDPLMRSYVQSVQKGTGIEKKNLKACFERALGPDPLKSVSSLSREDILMILAIFDRVIHFRYGLVLWRALRKPKTLFVPLGHYTSILAIPFLKGQILDFFKLKFDLKTTPS